MTLKKLFGMKLFAIALALFIVSSVTTEVAKAAYPPLPTWAYGCMSIQSIRIMDGATPIYNSTVTSCNQRDRTADPVQATSIKLESGKTYNIVCAGLCYGGSSCYYGGKIGAWIDFNGNQSYADAGERVMWNFFGTSYSTNITGSFTVPPVAQGKVFRMIFSCQYYYYCSDYGYYNVDPMYTGNHSPGYGDRACIDFYVENPAQPNAGAVSIVQPAGAITKGTQNIAVRIRNYDALAPLTSCRIIWRIDEGQPSQVSNTYNWTGNLAYNATTDVVVGSFNFNESRMYTIDAFTEFPNGKNDTDPSNDRCLRKSIAPALSPGNYYIGNYPGSSNTFSTITEATDYLTAAGLIGDGVMNIIFPKANPGPAVFSGPIIVGAYPSVGNNTVAIKSESGNPADVIVNFTPDGTTPYLLSMSNLKNTSIEGITFNTSTGISNSGIINLSNCQGVTIKDNLFLNKVGAAQSTNFMSVNLSNCYDITVKNNEFRDGSIAIFEIGTCPRKLELSYNTIKDYSWVGIQLSANSTVPCTENIVKIDTNKFSGTNMRMGISSTNGTEITRNQFNGFTGSSTSDAVIYVTNNDPINFTGTTTIDKNIMTAGITNINGIYAVNVPKLSITNNKVYTVDILGGGIAAHAVNISGSGSSSDPVYITKNEIKSGSPGVATASVNNYGLYTLNSTIRANYNDIDLISGSANVYSVYALNTGGYIANSQITAVEANGVYLNNSTLGFYYNSVANRSATYPALLINTGTGTIRRNIFQNEGTGPAVIATSATGNTIDENNYWTKNTSPTPTLGRWNGVNYATLADWQAASGKDANSSSIEISFFDFDAQNLSLNTFDEKLVFDSPIDFSSFPGYDAEIQQKDYLGQTRYSYFMGSENIVPEVFITNQPKGVMDCYGKTGYYIGVTAYVTRGVQARFEWYKDGKSLTELYKSPTENWAEKASIYLDSLPFAAGKPGLNYDMEGTYRCLVRGSGAEPKWSNSVLVNALSDAEITREPEDVRVDNGGTAIIEVEAHIVADEGIDDPLYQPEVQWYYTRNNQPVKNDLSVDGHFTGAKSTILTVRNIDDQLLSGPLQDGVYCVLKGSCNTLTSKTAFVKLFPQIFINQDPANATPCEGAAASFRITATSSDPDATLEYQWRKNGVAIPGATTNTYNIAAASAADVGTYDCVVTVIPG
ncbi:right-handed parallel beta-helix repeat-containing protein, partial [Bacteroidetes/Chlorobi group bacterium ChocPot_Mid]